MKKIGFEREYFLVDNKGKLVINPSAYGFTTDDFGILVEARGKASKDMDEAVLSLMFEEKKLMNLAKKQNLKLVLEPNKKLSKKELTEVYGRYSKDPSKAENMYGTTKELDFSRVNAGLHVHFSNEEKKTIDKTINYIFLPNFKEKEKKFTEKDTEEVIVNYFLNIPKIIRELDTIFKEEIKKANRRLGEYEIKPHGFEYRSLPNNIDILKVAEVAMNSLQNP